MFEKLTEILHKHNVTFLDCVKVSRLLPVMADILKALDIPTRVYECEDLKIRVTMICPKVKMSSALRSRLTAFGLTNNFVNECNNIKQCIFPQFAYRDFDCNNKWTFFSYNILNEIVGTEVEPHKDTTLCRVAMKQRFKEAVWAAPLESTLPPDVVLMERHLQQFSHPLRITTSQEFKDSRQV